MKKIAARCALLSLLVLASACAQLPGEMTTSEGVTNLQSPAPDPIASIAAQPAPVSTPVAAVATNIPETRIKTQPKDVWERVRNGYTMKPMDTDLVRHWESFYSAKPEYFARMVDRSRHYLFHIIEEIERRKMPAEIALLPMIESAYNPQAYGSSYLPPARITACARTGGMTAGAMSLPLPMQHSTIWKSCIQCSTTGNLRWLHTTGAKAPSVAPSRAIRRGACPPTTPA
jgi:hypothetical protein